MVRLRFQLSWVVGTDGSRGAISFLSATFLRLTDDNDIREGGDSRKKILTHSVRDIFTLSV